MKILTNVCLSSLLIACASSPASPTSPPTDETTATSTVADTAAAPIASSDATAPPSAASVPTFPSKEPLRALIRGVPVAEGKLAFLQNDDGSWSIDYSKASLVVTLRLPNAPAPNSALTQTAIASGLYTDTDGKNRQAKSSFAVSLEVDQALPPCPKKRPKGEWTEVGKVTGRVLVEITEADLPAKSFVSGAFEASVKCPPP
jgi:hypothetical protein